MKAIQVTSIFKSYLQIEQVETDTQVRLERLHTADAVCAVVFNTITRKLIFVRQYRPGPDADILELVAGKIDANELPGAAIIREIEEEIGYKVDSLQQWQEFYVSPGVSTEKITLFYATVSTQISAGGGLATENEDITIIEHSICEVSEMLRNTMIRDAKTLIGVYATMLYHEYIFGV